MATDYEQACPLCDSPAEYGFVDHGKRKYFECPKCRFFQISIRAEKLLAERYVNRKSGYAALALQAPKDHLLVIRMPDHEARLKGGDGLQATFVAKSELPLNCA
jgi:hypothetical protein